ncbi:MAG: AsmA family protein [Alphaproteobacteria bacterium]|nr:AsmA family protein [Alphaproteobacteria bacterium]
MSDDKAKDTDGAPESKAETKAEKKKDKKGRVSKWIWRLVKIALFLGVFLFILLTVLSRLGGNSEVLKGAIEDVLSDNSPYEVSIGRLSALHFFPNVIMDVQEVHFHEEPEQPEPAEVEEGTEEGAAEDSGEEAETAQRAPTDPNAKPTGKVLIRVADVKFVIGFWDALFRPGRIKDMQIRDVYVDSGTWLDKPVTIDSLLVDEYEDGKFALDLLGKIGTAPVNVAMDLETKGEGFSRVFILPDERAVRAKFGNLEMDAMFVDALGDRFQIENINLKNKDKQVLRGNLSFNPSEGQMDVSGQLRLEPHKSHLDPDINLNWDEEPLAISGSLSGDQVDLRDFDAEAPFMLFIDEVNAIFGDGKKSTGLDLSPVQLDLDVDFKDVHSGQLVLGSVSSKASLQASRLVIGPLSGKVFQGDLSGEISLAADTSPATFKNKILIKNLDYGYVQKQFKDNAEIEGKADLGITLESSGQSLDALIDGLSGRIDFVGGDAKMRSGLLEFWGGGLLNALMPKIGENEEVQVNCVVVNMDVKNLKGQSDAVFVDTGLVTLNGEGTYDFKDNHMDIVLDPKSKGVSVGDISAAVNVTGPIDDLQVSPNMMDLGKRVGGILLGAVNPAFYAFSIADLGLSDNHPCKDFIIQKEKLPAPDEEQAEQPAEDEVSEEPVELQVEEQPDSNLND